MGYLMAWKILEEIVVDFRKKGLSIPIEIMNDLKAAKTMIKILKADSGHGENLQKIEQYLEAVEVYLISNGQEVFGAHQVDIWLERLSEARKRTDEDDEEKEMRFISGVPREQKWILVRPSDELPVGKLEALAEESSLSYTFRDDGSFIVYGKDEHVKAFVKKMTTKYGLETER